MIPSSPRWLPLLALQRVVWVRPPAGSLRRGLVAAPAVPTLVVLALLVLGLLGWSLYRRLRHASSR